MAKSEAEQDEDLMQQELQPSEETPEVVADSGEERIGGIAFAVPEIVPTHPVFGFRPKLKSGSSRTTKE